MMNNSKQKVHDFWNNSSCGEELYLSGENKESFTNHSEIRYQLEPYIQDFADFESYKGKKVLEIGLGLGADHQKYAEAGANLTGIDLTQRAADFTKSRLNCFGLSSKISVGDAENLEFPDEVFDLVYSWGVIHHSPDTIKFVEEIWRVLVPGAEAKIMIYHKWSIMGIMLWIRYGLLILRPWRSLDYIYANYLESFGTKAYSKKEALKLFSKFNEIRIDTVLTHGDLLTSDAGQRHKGLVLDIAKKIWPRRIIKFLFNRSGLFMLIHVKK